MAGVRCSICSKFYNPEKFSECPFCNSNSIGQKASTEKSSHDSVSISQIKDSAIDALLEKALEKSSDNEGKTVSFFGGFVSSESQDTKDDQEDSLFYEDTKSNEINLMDSDDNDTGTANEISLSKANDKGNEIIADKVEVSVNSPESVTEKNQISNTADSGDGKTWGYFKSLKSEVASSVAQEQKQQQNVKKTGRPVVGWLVCVKGIHFGESFEFYEGSNSLGRFSENDIVISDDRSVSREAHIFIIYDAKKGDYYIKPGTSHSIPRLNDSPILEVMLIKSNDLIEVGEENFVFIPLCGEEFDWQKYIIPEE